MAKLAIVGIYNWDKYGGCLREGGGCLKGGSSGGKGGDGGPPLINKLLKFVGWKADGKGTFGGCGGWGGGGING